MSYRPEKLELELMEDEQAVIVNLYRVTRDRKANATPLERRGTEEARGKSHPGVTQHKSFKSAVEDRVPPGNRRDRA